MNIVFVNGQFIDKDQATISIMDRGFLFGDAVYEVIPYFNGNPVGLIAHLQRLQQSLESIQLLNPYSLTKWQHICAQLQQKNATHDTDFSLYLQVTRGSYEQRHHAFPDNIQPTAVAFCTKMLKPHAKNGAKAITLPDYRHYLCHIKSTNLLANVLAFNLAKQQGAIDAILYRDGNIIECTCSNLLIIKNGKVLTPPLQANMLPGITRQLVLDIAGQHQIPYQELPLTLNDLHQADEVWITSSSKSLVPIIQINDNTVNQGTPGPIGSAIKEYFITQYKHCTTGEVDG